MGVCSFRRSEMVEGFLFFSLSSLFILFCVVVAFLLALDRILKGFSFSIVMRILNLIENVVSCVSFCALVRSSDYFGTVWTDNVNSDENEASRWRKFDGVYPCSLNICCKLLKGKKQETENDLQKSWKYCWKHVKFDRLFGMKIIQHCKKSITISENLFERHQMLKAFEWWDGTRTQ